MASCAYLPDRSVLAVSGEDRVTFLQGLVSNDVAQAAPGHAVWAALLTPQGKWLADFFILADGPRLLLDVEAAQAGMIATRLTRHRLRSKVEVAPAGLVVHAVWGGDPPAGAITAPDPRLPEAGWRVLAPALLPDCEDAAAYDLHRLMLGLPDGSRDLEADKTVLLEAGFDVLNGVSWTKGCYMGQELTARTRYRGLVKRKLVPVRGTALPPPGTPVLRGASEVGQMRSSRDGLGLASLRLEALRAENLTAGGHPVQLALPEWLRSPDQD
jgi:folate-binding protein YgfZ